MLQKKVMNKKRENLIMYKKSLNTFCRKVDGSRDIEWNTFFKMAATLIPIRPRQFRFRFKRHPPTSPKIIPCSLFFFTLYHLFTGLWRSRAARRAHLRRLVRWPSFHVIAGDGTDWAPYDCAQLMVSIEHSQLGTDRLCTRITVHHVDWTHYPWI